MYFSFKLAIFFLAKKKKKCKLVIVSLKEKVNVGFNWLLKLKPFKWLFCDQNNGFMAFDGIYDLDWFPVVKKKKS